MTKLFMPIPESNESTTRPVVFGVTRDILQMTDLPEDTYIFYPGDLEKGMQPGSQLEQEAGINMMPFINRVFIEVEENYEMDRMLSTAVYQSENLYIFRDDLIETSIKPVYSSADITINFKYRAVDKTSAIRWRDNIRTRVAMSWDMRLHELEYHYLIPPEFLVILNEIHRMRENVDGYGDTYDKYFNDHVSKKATIFTTLAGTQGAWGIAEKQLRVVGYFDFDTVPELGAKEDDADTWTISFSYKFKYDKPIACVMFYPLMVHNQLVAQNYRPDPIADNPNPLEDKIYARTLSSLNFSMFEKTNQDLLNWRGIAIPSYDDFFPSCIPDNTSRVFTALVNIDTTNPKFLLSLKHLGGITINPIILDFLLGELPYIFKVNLSVFNISFYRSIELQNNDVLTIDNDLNIFSVNELSLRDYYHIRFGIAIDLSLLSQAAKDRLRNNAAALLLILNEIDPSLAANGLLPKVLGNNYVTRTDFNNTLDMMKGTEGKSLNSNRNIDYTSNNQIYQFNTVQTLSIIAEEQPRTN